MNTKRDVEQQRYEGTGVPRTETDQVTKTTTTKHRVSEPEPEVTKEVVTETVTTKLTFEQRFDNAKALAQAAVNDLVTVGNLHASAEAQRRAKELQDQVNAL